MFARLVTFHGQPNKLQDAVREWEARSTGMESTKGLQHVYVLTDKKTGNFTVVSFWDTEENLNASMNTIMPMGEAVARLLSATRVPTPETYEVSSERGEMMRKAA